MSRFSLRIQISLFLSVLALLMGIVYTILLGITSRQAFVAEVDAGLLSAAASLEATVGSNYHSRIVDATSVSSEAYTAGVASHNALCRELGLTYLWSVLVLDTNEIVFTSATSPSLDISRSDHAGFFDRHTDPGAYDPALVPMQTAFCTFHNKWGAGRMVLIPRRDEHGRTYILGASVQLEAFASMVLATILRSAGVGLLILAVALLAGLLLTRHLSNPLNRLTRAAERIAEGHLDEPVPIAGARETFGLGSSFAAMRDAVKARMEELRSSEENLSTTLDSIGDAVIVTDAAGKITRMNPVAETLTGWKQTEALHRELPEIFIILNSRTREPVQSPVERVLLDGRVVGLANDTLLKSRDGTERQIADSGAPIRDVAGRIIGVVLVFRDVTREHMVQAELRHVHKMQAIGELAGGIAHDFNNMLSIVLGNAQLLHQNLDSLENNTELLELTSGIEQAALRGSELTRQLLGFARKSKVQELSVNIHQTINDVANLLRHSVDPRVEIDLKLNASRAVVKGDVTELQNALLNLGVNAADAMPDGGQLTIGTREVEIGEDRALPGLQSGPHIEICLRDTGIGMEPAVLERLFEPFFTTKPQGKGTGLGLSAVYGTVQSHSGRITVSSEPGKGSMFTICLPLSDGEADAAGQSDSDRVTGRRTGGTLMVVDDEADILNFLSAAISRLGHNCITFDNGQQAIDRFAESPEDIDMVILDQRMPGMSGRQVFQALKKIDPGVRVVIASGYSDPEVIADLLSAGVLDYLAKPFRIEELSAKIAKYLPAVRGLSS